MSFVFVALGGALGAVTRYAISLIPVKTQFPILTLVTNILGAILFGRLVYVGDSQHFQRFHLRQISCLKTRHMLLGECM